MKKYFKSGFATIALALFCSAFAATEANAQPVQDKILRKMDNHYKSVQTLKAGVKMVKFDSLLKESDVTEGSAIYVPVKNGDPYVRIDWTKPRTEYLSSYKGTYTVFQPTVPKCFAGKTKEAKGSGKAGNALSFLNMTRAQLNANYMVSYLGDENLSDGTATFHLEMKPRSPQEKYKAAHLWVDTNGMVRQAQVVEANDDTTTIFLYNVVKNDKVNGSLFEVKVPGNVKCVPV